MMQGFLDDAWLKLGAIAAALAVAAWLLGALWDRVLIPLALRHQGELDDRLAHAAKRATQALLFAGVLLIVLDDLSGSPAIAGAHATRYLRGLLVIATTLSAAWLCTRLVEELAAWYLERLSRSSESRVDQQLMPVVRWASRLVFLFVALTVILGTYNIRITALLGAAGVASLAVALAAQETLANVIGGLVIMVDRPFRVGDSIELPDGKGGIVVGIGLRSTRMRTQSGALLVVPNTDLVKSRIMNWAGSNAGVVVQTIGIGYASDVTRARTIVLDVLAANPRVLKSPAPGVFFTEFGDSALQLVVTYTASRFEQALEIRSEVNCAIKAALEAEGIEIPFPQRVVHVHGAPGGPAR